jgi:hypothetical protein
VSSGVVLMLTLPDELTAKAMPAIASSLGRSPMM